MEGGSSSPGTPAATGEACPPVAAVHDELSTTSAGAAPPSPPSSASSVSGAACHKKPWNASCGGGSGTSQQIRSIIAAGSMVLHRQQQRRPHVPPPLPHPPRPAALPAAPGGLARFVMRTRLPQPSTTTPPGGGDDGGEDDDRLNKMSPLRLERETEEFVHLCTESVQMIENLQELLSVAQRERDEVCGGRLKLHEILPLPAGRSRTAPDCTRVAAPLNRRRPCAGSQGRCPPAPRAGRLPTGALAAAA